MRFPAYVSRETTGPKALSFLTRAGMNNQIRNPESAATPNARLYFCRRPPHWHVVQLFFSFI
ncbi:MAG: hypothetical protein II680_06655, partial [Clostridia bacterium]|nr:hypothetical protein [Clostridia bacterium]